MTPGHAMAPGLPAASARRGRLGRLLLPGWFVLSLGLVALAILGPSLWPGGAHKFQANVARHAGIEWSGLTALPGALTYIEHSAESADLAFGPLVRSASRRPGRGLFFWGTHVRTAAN